MKAALERMDAKLYPLEVTRQANVVSGTFTWFITFPFAIGHYNVLDVDANALIGLNVHAVVSELQVGRKANVQRIRTLGSSSLSGHFYLYFASSSSNFSNLMSTIAIPYDASAKFVQRALEMIPNIGSIEVTRFATGSVDYKTWNTETTDLEATDLRAPQVHLDAVHSLFEYDLRTYDWLVTFTSKSGEVPILSGCCDEDTTANTDKWTLRSDWSGDSRLIIENVVGG
jgi:hypothetical protein